MSTELWNSLIPLSVMGVPRLRSMMTLVSRWPTRPNLTRPRCCDRVAQLIHTELLVRSVRYGARVSIFLAPGRLAEALPDRPATAAWTSTKASRIRPPRPPRAPRAPRAPPTRDGRADRLRWLVRGAADVFE